VTALREENAYFSIGERCNANGSKRWRELQAAHDWDGCVAMGREQVGEGSNSLDICTAFVGRDKLYQMGEVIRRFTPSVNAPLVIDSTETNVIEAALKLHGGKPIINSINFEEGEGAARDRMILARKFGAAVIALTIDEGGMAKTVEDKLRIARRLVDFACDWHGLPQSDLLIDPLTFTIATGNEDDRKLGLWTLDGIRMIRDAFPDIQIILGLSNISFGLNPAARHVLNSVFLDHALRAGMTGAIVHVSKIRPLHQIPPEEVQVAEDLIFDRRREGYDPLQRMLELFADRGDDSNPFRAALAERGITACIPPQKNRKQPIPYDKALYRQRHRIAIAFARLEDWRRIATRYDRCATISFGAITLAAIVIFWLNPCVLRLASGEKIGVHHHDKALAGKNERLGNDECRLGGVAWPIRAAGCGDAGRGLGCR
jgi:5-methyltetrahydrofolate--homocysteine methyltransferase